VYVYAILICIFLVCKFLTSTFVLKHSLTENAVLELGAEWVHGEVGNVVCAMAQKYGLLTASRTGLIDTTYIDSTGKIIDQEVSEKIIGILSVIHNTADTMLKDFKGSLGDYYNAV
jgi:hypothetical protein